jgi:hypothetical protein
MNNQPVSKGDRAVVAVNWKSKLERNLPKGTMVRVLGMRGDSALVTVQLTGKPVWADTFAVPIDILNTGTTDPLEAAVGGLPVSDDEVELEEGGPRCPECGHSLRVNAHDVMSCRCGYQSVVSL